MTRTISKHEIEFTAGAVAVVIYHATNKGGYANTTAIKILFLGD